MDLDTLIPPAVRAYLPLLKGILTATLMIIGGWIASKWVHRLMLRALSLRQLDQALGRFLASIVRYLVLAAAVLAAMESVGLHTTSLVAILASAGLAVGLALQGSLGNFASGVMILFFRPFQLGDKIGISDKVGLVEDIGLFNTTLVTLNNEKLIIPNSSVTGGIITNFSDRGTLRGVLIVPMLAPIGDLPRITQVLLSAARRSGGVAAEPAPAVQVADFDHESIDLGLAVWYKANDEPQVMHNLRCAVLEEATGAGLKVAPRPEFLLQKA